jgi:hypothetical protein
MTDADASEAARELSRHRWGDTRVRTLVDELVRRVADVDAEQAERLRAVLDESRQRRRVASA